MVLPYVLNNGNLEKFFDEMRTAAVPNKLDYKYLQSRGYTGKNDQYLVAFMRNLGFIDRTGAPQKRWLDHRHTDESKKVRGAAVREAYSGFFGLYHDADRKSESDFSNWARTEDPQASPTTIKRSWATFRTIVKISDFTGAMSTPDPEPSGNSTDELIERPASVDPSALDSVGRPVQIGGMGSITINVELQLPATADAHFFDQFFSSMRKHLIENNE